ncbi:MAG: hypothetical protein AABY34_04825 [Pseudomonadota bacterium]
MNKANKIELDKLGRVIIHDKAILDTIGGATGLGGVMPAFDTNCGHCGASMLPPFADTNCPCYN